jgi:ATP-dependent DNA helicase RecG
MENQNVEYKQSWRDEYLKWVCGFANAQGGKIYIGLDDEGIPVDLKDSKKLLENIPNKILNHLAIVCDVNLLTDDNKEYIEIVVEPKQMPVSYHGAFHYRSGTTKQELTGNALTEFILEKTGGHYDALLEKNASIDNIDLGAVEAFKKGAIRSGRLPQVENEDVLQVFRNLKLVNEKDQLNKAALVLFGKDPREYSFNAYAKIGKFGDSDADLQFQEVVEGNAFELADKILEVLDKKYFKKAISYDGLHRVETPEYPYEAIREVLLNAIIHRKYLGPAIQISIYDDKIMVWNFGLLPEPLNFEDLKQKHSSYPRNPKMADVFYKGGLIEHWGRGTIKIFEECKKAGLPEPTFSDMTGGVVVTLYKDVYNEKYLQGIGLSKRQIKSALHTNTTGSISNKEYQDIADTSRKTALRDIQDLIDKDVLEKVPDTVGKATRYRIVRK